MHCWIGKRKLKTRCIFHQVCASRKRKRERERERTSNVRPFYSAQARLTVSNKKNLTDYTRARCSVWILESSFGSFFKDSVLDKFPGKEDRSSQALPQNELHSYRNTSEQMSV
ncbi:hypothetical protein AVEN_146670-1 [Araneus ventricosus]|uniref:Uncharacterized protein n=1 Tax=Araneus ventricosus TaxID=182803 RepID=A0A4Y2KQ01_ARAVE|nr:hypothetical protein AVEN_146670-1 [Araneus ventricosus]